MLGQPGIWAHRLIGDIRDCVITRGLVYHKQSDGTKMQMSEFADRFFSILLDI